MEVGEVMNRNALCLRPDATIREAAGWMKVFDRQSLPVCFQGRLIGLMTDSLVNQLRNRHANAPVRDAMCTEVHFCFEDQEVVDVSQAMIDERIDQLPVLDADLQFVGNVSLQELTRALNRRPMHAHNVWTAALRVPSMSWQH